jgi:hypothetical protein
MKFRVLIQWGVLNKGEHSEKGGRGSFCCETFYYSYENLIQSPNLQMFKMSKNVYSWQAITA